MTKSKKIIGLDVGGTHVTAALITIQDGQSRQSNRVKKELNSLETAGNIVAGIGDCICELINAEPGIEAIGIAFPGPFDYEKGVAAIAKVGGKFEHIFGLHIQQALTDFTGLNNIPIRFVNDAHCFAMGAYHNCSLNSKRTVFITLGTGFGSAFMVDGRLVYAHDGLPASGAFFNQEFLEATADDYFSTRWFLHQYKVKTGKEIFSVKKMAESEPDTAAIIFEEFGTNLGNFLLSWLNKFNCDELVIGGNIARSAELFNPALQGQLKNLVNPVNVVFCPDTEECILTGAAINTQKGQVVIDSKPMNLRKTTQPLLPVGNAKMDKEGYHVFPSFSAEIPVYKGFDALAEIICSEKLCVIDGYGGVLWEHFRKHLHRALQSKNKKLCWYDVSACLKSGDAINAMLAENLNGDDPVFGKKYTGVLADFFDAELLPLLQPDPSADLCILYGTGAALAGWKAPLIYVDVPKNEIQYRMRAGSVTNIGNHVQQSNSQLYKRFYFADWPVLNKHKAQLLPKIDYIVDEQRIDEITWMRGDDFRKSLQQLLQQPFRARPWFEAGIWGGQWMKQHIEGLNKSEVNYAWSFELITPENGIVIEGNGQLLEVSFDFLLFYDHKKFLGNAARRFGNEFPIRFDFLDTFDGGNLSIQCHPRTSYIKENFGENFTQDETYYILDCEPDAKVYLGFQQDINPDDFKKALLDAQQNGIEMNVEKYVQKLPARKHDLFLIANGTIHASGKNNMVLEISSTPYIYTFKMYDWQRLDLNGQPRPINIEHAFNNLYFDRKGNYVAEKLLSKAIIEQEWPEGRKLKLPTHEEHFYAVDRYEFTGNVSINTNNQCHICMLVEGDRIEATAGNTATIFCYAETFVIPAGVKQYTLKQQGEKKAFVVVAYVKEECC